MSYRCLFSLFVLWTTPSLLLAAPITRSASAAPIVDLGYTLHQGSLQNTDTGLAYLNFSNIRYAAPPTGALRFAAPVSPSINRTVQDGQTEFICPQSDPSWLGTAIEVITDSPITPVQPFTAFDIGPVDPRTSEDCLFLNLLVSSSVYDARGQGAGSAVIVWIHGGGYVQGFKDNDGDGQDFISHAQSTKDEGVIYVAINYRLGMFGWLGSDTQQYGAVANAGLLDQRFAFEWVQTHIHLFGGDPKRVTVLGESAGAGSIMHHITAYGGLLGSAPFSQAITQSTFSQAVSPVLQRSTYESILQAANVSSFAQLKSLPTDTLQTVNAIVAGNAAPYGTFGFGPVVDGTYVPDLPSVLLAEGRYNHDITIMTGHNADEGLLFASPFVTDDSSYKQLLAQLLPDATPTVISYISSTLYPSDLSGRYGYTSELGRVNTTIADYSILCNTYSQNTAFGARSYAYEFSVPPATHSIDLAYTFYDGGDGEGINTTLAEAMQTYFTNFAITGSPAASGLPPFPSYKGDAEEDFGDGVLGPIKDDISTTRCAWWQQALYK